MEEVVDRREFVNRRLFYSPESATHPVTRGGKSGKNSGVLLRKVRASAAVAEKHEDRRTARSSNARILPFDPTISIVYKRIPRLHECARSATRFTSVFGRANRRILQARNSAEVTGYRFFFIKSERSLSHDADNKIIPFAFTPLVKIAVKM